MSAKELSVHTV